MISKSRLVRRIFAISLGPLLLTQCQVMGPPAAPPHVMVMPASRFSASSDAFGEATQIVVHRNVTAPKLERAFPKSAGYAHVYSPEALRIVEKALERNALSANQRRQLVATLNELKYFERKRRLAIQASVPAGPSRLWMLQRATHR
jgi:hypothetical protein